jgi:hypothetical protein
VSDAAVLETPRSEAREARRAVTSGFTLASAGLAIGVVSPRLLNRLDKHTFTAPSGEVEARRWRGAGFVGARVVGRAETDPELTLIATIRANP